MVVLHVRSHDDAVAHRRAGAATSRSSRAGCGWRSAGAPAGAPGGGTRRSCRRRSCGRRSGPADVPRSWRRSAPQVSARGLAVTARRRQARAAHSLPDRQSSPGDRCETGKAVEGFGRERSAAHRRQGHGGVPTIYKNVATSAPVDRELAGMECHGQPRPGVTLRRPSPFHVGRVLGPGHLLTRSLYRSRRRSRSRRKSEFTDRDLQARLLVRPGRRRRTKDTASD